MEKATISFDVELTSDCGKNLESVLTKIMSRVPLSIKKTVRRRNNSLFTDSVDVNYKINISVNKTI